MKGQIVADFLAAHPIPADSPLNDLFPDEHVSSVRNQNSLSIPSKKIPLHVTIQTRPVLLPPVEKSINSISTPTDKKDWRQDLIDYLQKGILPQDHSLAYQRALS